MAYVTIPKDLSRIQSKVLFGLTKRQVICFGAAALVGVPLFFLNKGALGTTTAALCMILVMLPFFLFAMYEKNGQPLEVFLGHLIQNKFIRPKAHGLFYIFKIIVAAEHDNVDLPVFFPDPSDQLYSIHYRHGKICHKHIYLFFPKEVVGFFTILRIIHDLISCFSPGIQ